MFGIGMSEAVLILAVALLVFGPDKLPEVARMLAKGMKELRKASDELKSTVNFGLEDLERTRPAPPPPRVIDVTASTSSAAAAPASTDAPALEAAKPSTDVWPRAAEGALARGALDNLPDDDDHRALLAAAHAPEPASTGVVDVAAPSHRAPEA